MNKPLNWEVWLAKNEALTAAILAKRGEKYIDVDAIWAESRADLEMRHDYLVFDYRGEQTDMQNSILANYVLRFYSLGISVKNLRVV